MAPKCLITNLGPKREDELGFILPHEHIFANFTRFDQSGYDQIPVEDVLRVIGPEIELAKAAGVTALAEATSIGGARRADVLKAVSDTTDFPILAATGIFREPWITDWAQTHSEEALRDWMLSELTSEIESSGVRAGWIKLRSGDDGLSEGQTKLLSAAARTGAATGAVIGSHTVRGRVARDQVDVIERAGYAAERFIWIHAQVEPEFEWNLELARRGAWIEYDGIGDSPADVVYLQRIRRMWDAGFGAQVLLSHDRGWYDPCEPNGGMPKPYTYLSEVFLPKLRTVGLDEAAIRQMTHSNPFRAFARPI